NFVRICAVEKLITETDSLITDAVLSSGFNTISNFNRIYKQFRGYSPSQYADNNRILSEI
ncbi:MAG: helix-turn-helix domain-containing protein, partial [Bacillota bacterium]|nr:helix-turn-helix domain-containing protein [Bacillota bacterium]